MSRVHGPILAIELYMDLRMDTTDHNLWIPRLLGLYPMDTLNSLIIPEILDFETHL